MTEAKDQFVFRFCRTRSPALRWCVSHSDCQGTDPDASDGFESLGWLELAAPVPAAGAAGKGIVPPAPGPVKRFGLALRTGYLRRVASGPSSQKMDSPPTLVWQMLAVHRCLLPVGQRALPGGRAGSGSRMRLLQVSSL